MEDDEELYILVFHYLPNVDGHKWQEDQQGKCLHIGKHDDQDAFKEIQTVVEAVLNPINDPPLVLRDPLLQDLVDSEVHNPQPESGEDDSKQEYRHWAVLLYKHVQR